MKNLLRTLINYLGNSTQPNSLSHQYRKRRWSVFQQTFGAILTQSCRILDVGGTQNFWEMMEYNHPIVLINIRCKPSANPNFRHVEGDCRNMSQFKTKEFDLVFSNSLIEHVGDFHAQKQVANEIRRIGMNYFVQTPNKYFPIEPHFLCPFLQFLPSKLRLWFAGVWPLRRSHIDPKETLEIRLLTKKELKELFPEAQILEERVLGLTKSFMCIHYNAPH